MSTEAANVRLFLDFVIFDEGRGNSSSVFLRGLKGNPFIQHAKPVFTTSLSLATAVFIMPGKTGMLVVNARSDYSQFKQRHAKYNDTESKDCIFLLFYLLCNGQRFDHN